MHKESIKDIPNGLYFSWNYKDICTPKKTKTNTKKKNNRYMSVCNFPLLEKKIETYPTTQEEPRSPNITLTHTNNNNYHFPSISIITYNEDPLAHFRPSTADKIIILPIPQRRNL